MQLVQGAKQQFRKMDTEHRYKLERGSKKYLCPNCGKISLKRYIDIDTGDHLPDQYGRCDHENSCVPHYHMNPYTDGYAKAIKEQERVNVATFPEYSKPKSSAPQPQPNPKPVYFDFDTFKQTLQPEKYEKNTFLQNLFSRVQFPFEANKIEKVIQLYRLGTVANGYRAGAVTFPFIDNTGNVRTIQVKQFDDANHTTGTDFLHSIIEKHHTRNNEPLPTWLKDYIRQDKRVSCLFGEHLLNKYPLNPIALVEAPKTAVYGTLYFGLPKTQKNLVWLAVYNKSSFSIDKVKALKGRDIFVFPDLSKDGATFTEWETKAKEFEIRLPGTRFIFSDLLERLATPEQRTQGADIADIIIKLNWQLFRKKRT